MAEQNFAVLHCGKKERKKRTNGKSHVPLKCTHMFFFCKLEFLNLGLANPGMELYNFITRIQNGY